MNSDFDQLDPVLQHHIVNSLGWPGLRPLQEAAIEPLLRGEDALLIAPTAGGKTEAALFPLLTTMQEERWQGTSVLYLTPLRALLNNLEPRIRQYTSWLGRTVGVRHGDTTEGERQRLLRQPPDVLLTTPESLEAMLISTKVTPEDAFGAVRAIVIDEIHSFGGDDRGWHLKALINRVSMLVGIEVQRVGLSATMGNPDDLMAWLLGAKARWTDGTVLSPKSAPLPDPVLQVDHVGSDANAASLIAGLHQGEKRLVFCESRRQVESLATALRPLDVETYLSHSSLSISERRAAETAFTHARDCVIIATSTLELGIDVGDLDRVIQVGAPRTVASMLQRLGRTGRRPGTTRNTLFVGLKDDDLVGSLAVLLLWSEGFVEPVVPPPDPVHVMAQQMLAVTLQYGRMSVDDLDSIAYVLPGDPDQHLDVIDWLEETGHFDRDGDFLMVGPEAERRYGRRYFRDLVAVFTAPPQFQIFHGRSEVGSIDPMMLTRPVEGPRVITLGGRGWRVGHIDWRRRRAYVESSDVGGDVLWTSAPWPDSYWVTDAARRVLLGATPEGVKLTGRAERRLAALREEYARRVHPDATVVRGTEWWTWAGARANALLSAAVEFVAPELLDDAPFTNRVIHLAKDARSTALAAALRKARRLFGDDLGDLSPKVTDDALKGLKFAEMLPPDLAIKTLGARNADHEGAAQVLSRTIRDAA